jgi:hypothetical protein
MKCEMKKWRTKKASESKELENVSHLIYSGNKRSLGVGGEGVRIR